MDGPGLSAALFDAVLVATLLATAWASLFSRDLFRGVVLFIAFGLLLALVWARLGAVDVALAEAAVGSGMTGALLLAALARLGGDEAAGAGAGPVTRIVAGVGCAALAALLAWALLALAPAGEGLTQEVQASLAASGVSSPVTAVLLNFRGYDTLLELGVLLLAAAGAWSLGGHPVLSRQSPGPVLRSLVAVLAPLLILAAGYLLWRGGHAPGGAFQAGALVGAAGVLMVLTEPRALSVRAIGLLRPALVLGLLVFLAVALAVMPGGSRLLQYPQEMAGALILLIEAAATLSIGATLLALFLGGEPGPAGTGQGEH